MVGKDTKISRKRRYLPAIKATSCSGKPDRQNRAEDHERDGEEIAQRDDGTVVEGQVPVQFGHGLEVHAVDRGDERRGHEDHGSHREDLDDAVLLDVDQTQRGVLDVVQSLKAEVGVVDQRINILDHQLQTRVDIVRETLRAEDARQHALAVEDVLAQEHRALLQGADPVQHLLVDRILRVHVLRQGRNLLGDQLHEIGVEVDTHLQQRDEEVIAGRIAPIAHLEAFLRLTEGPELGVAHRDQHTLVRDDERHRLDDERIARRDKEVRVRHDGILALRVFRRRFDLLHLLLGLKTDLHEILDGLLFLDRRLEHVDPQNVVVTQLVEQPRIRIPDDLVVLLEVNCYHDRSLVKFLNPHA